MILPHLMATITSSGRGIVVGDIFRRLVARTIAQQFRAKVEVATSPHQYALKTKAGCETVAHILQALTDFDGDATVMSVDGVGAFDLISRVSMMKGCGRWREDHEFRKVILRTAIDIFGRTMPAKCIQSHRAKAASKEFLQNKNSELKVLLDRIPAVQDTQSAWLLLSFSSEL